MKTLIFTVFIAASALAQVPALPGAALPKRPLGVPAEKPLAPKFICSTPWKFDHPDTKGVPLKLKLDGTMESRTWRGLWKQSGPRQFTMTIAGKRTSVINFSEDGMTYTGIHFDGAPVAGKRVGDVPADSRVSTL